MPDNHICLKINLIDQYVGEVYAVDLIHGTNEHFKAKADLVQLEDGFLLGNPSSTNLNTIFAKQYVVSMSTCCRRQFNKRERGKHGSYVPI